MVGGLSTVEITNYCTRYGLTDAGSLYLVIKTLVGLTGRATPAAHLPARLSACDSAYHYMTSASEQKSARKTSPAT